MLRVDEAAVLCDLAEEYHIYDIKALPATKAALFVCGLGENSRIKRKISGNSHTITELLLALAVDSLALLVWQNSADGHAGRNKPKSIYSALVWQEETTEIQAFGSAEDFDKAFYGRD